VVELVRHGRLKPGCPQGHGGSNPSPGIHCDDGGVADLRVRLTPRGGRDAVMGRREDGVLMVRVTAPPADGKANAALCKLLAKALRVPRTSVSIVRGETARDKLVRIDGLSAVDAHARLGTSEPGPPVAS
jgi:uncharacterized protein (TIGR00251 family)